MFGGMASDDDWVSRRGETMDEYVARRTAENPAHLTDEQRDFIAAVITPPPRRVPRPPNFPRNSGA